MYSFANVTGIVLGGLTTPVFNLTTDTPPTPNSRQAIVTSLGGTQPGVRTHSPSDPFSVTVTKPLVPVPLPFSSNNQMIGKAGRNKYTQLFRKGTIPLIGQSPQISDIRIDANIVSGADVNDKANLAALWSMAAAFCAREAANSLEANITGGI